MLTLIEQLTVCNKLMALAIGTDGEWAFQLERAIEFAQGHTSGPSLPIHSLSHCAEQLLQIHLQGQESCSFQFWDLCERPNDSLWLYARVLDHLRELAGPSNAMLLISGLRDLVCPPGRYWTKARQVDYEQTQQLIEQLVAAYAPPQVRFYLVFI